MSALTHQLEPAADEADLAQGLGAPELEGAPPTNSGAEAEATRHRASRRGAPQDPLEIPLAVQVQLERMMGFDVSQIRIREDQSAVEMGAQAYTQGDEIVFAPGAFRPETPEGVALLGHELAHVVQQRGGRVPGGDGAVNGDPALETEADALGKQAGGTDVPGGQAAPVAEAMAPADALSDDTAAQDTSSATVDGGAAPVQLKITTGPTVYESDAAVVAKTVSEFVRYMDAQADWTLHYSAADKAKLQQLAHDLRADSTLPGPLQDFTISDLLALDAAKWVALRAYAAAVRTPAAVPTAKVARVPVLADALKLGEALPKLVTACGSGGRLFHISSTESIAAIVTAGRVDDFVAYCAAAQPNLEAPEGAEFDSFLDSAAGEYVGLKALLPKVRNVHRFQGDALRDMLASQAGVGTKPLLLILHSGMDYNSAFHHDVFLTSAIGTLAANNVVYMIEGAASLAEMEGQLGSVASTYGIDGKIGQVMIAGHGNARVVEMAGTTHVDTTGAVPTVEGTHDALDLDNNEAATNHFLDTLLSHMGDGADQRIVFNACLMDTHDVEIDPADDPSSTIAQTLANQPNLVERLRERATAKGVSVDVVGAVASFTEGPSYVDPAGNLGLSWTEDPDLTTTDKLRYVGTGIDPTGVIRAILEKWEPTAGVTPVPAWLAAVNGRLGRTVDTWNGAIIEAMLTMIQAKPDDAAQIAALENIVYDIENAHSPAHADPAALAALPQALAIPVFTKLQACGAWPGRQSVGGLAVLQAWASWDATKLTDLVALATTKQLKHSGIMLHVGFLLGQPGMVSAMLPTASAGAPSWGQLLFAFTAHDAGGHPDATAFLRAVLTSAGATDFPAGLKCDEIFDDGLPSSVATELTSAGGGGGGGSGGGGGGDVAANLDRNQNGTNETHVESMAAYGEIIDCYALYIRQLPSMSGRPVGALSRGDQVYVYGVTNGWYAIEHGGKTGFIYQRYVALT